MQHKGTQRLLTSRLELRRLTLADAEQMYAHWAADREVTRFLTWPPHATVDVTRGVLEEWVAGYASDDFYQWGIVLNKTSELVGTISVVSIDDDVDAVEIGYCLGRAWWSKGIMTEALHRILIFLFETVGFHRVALCHDVQNPASGRVMEKCGLRLEGVARHERKRRDGSWMDVAHYAILSEDRR